MDGIVWVLAKCVLSDSIVAWQPLDLMVTADLVAFTRDP